MIFDSGPTGTCFLDLKVNDGIQPIELHSTSPSSLPELNIMGSSNSQPRSIESSNAPPGTLHSPVEEESAKKFLKCDYCDKTFTLANVLKVHQRIHTGEKPYVCEICGKAFNQSGSLNRHRNTHRYRDATDNNFVCRFCNSKFPHGSLLETHEKSAHHNRRSGRPRNLSSVDNSVTSIDGHNGETFVKFNFTDQNELKLDKLSPQTTENCDLKREHNSFGGSCKYAFVCPYCKLGLNDINELGIHLSHHNISNGLVSGSSEICSPINTMLCKSNPLFSPESLVHQLNSLSKKLKIPPNSEFNNCLGIGSVSSSSFLPISFDRLRSTDSIPNMSFHMSNNTNPTSITSNSPALLESYNLAAFVLATLSKDYMYNKRSQPPPIHADTRFPLPNTEFLKSHLFDQKSQLLSPITNSTSMDFYSLLNIPKPLHHLACSENTTSSIGKPENDKKNDEIDGNFNAAPLTNSSPTIFRPQSNGKEAVKMNSKASVPRSSPTSSGNMTHSSSIKTADIFFSRKNGGERRKCPDCDKQFTCESALRIHYRKHSGERPYACEFCSKTFSQNGTLKRHHLTCKNRPSILSNTKIKSMKSSMPQDPDSTQEVNNSSTGSNYALSSSPTYPSAHSLNYIMSGKVLNSNDSLTKFEHFANKTIFQPILRSPYNNIGSSEEPTDLTINSSRNEETVSPSMDGECHLDIDSIDDNKMMFKCEENHNENMETVGMTTDTKMDFCDSKSSHYVFGSEKNVIYNFSTREILTHLVENGRLKMCHHCLIYFENEKTHSSHIIGHSEKENSLECCDCNFVAKDEEAFKDHFNNITRLSQNQ